ncbi:MAG: glycosyltransferase [Candidatus Thorarchaeota archaeon]|nr:MAG: glycosyltransferase [Candidatus Thorarchaeota archaeon]
MKSVIIPTLNEEENIGRLIRLIYEHVESEVSVVVVDDESTDGTREVVRNLESEYNVKLLLRRGRRGLASAVRYAAETTGNGSVAVMDADLSHHPKYLPLLFEKIEEGYDVAVGSRYTAGNRIKGWPGHRVALSKGAGIIASALLGVRVTDPMSGFVALKSSEILVGGIRHSDCKFLLEILATDESLRVAEVPIDFQNRKYGKSKLTVSTTLRYINQVLRHFVTRDRRSLLTDHEAAKEPDPDFPVDASGPQQTDMPHIEVPQSQRDSRSDTVGVRG